MPGVDQIEQFLQSLATWMDRISVGRFVTAIVILIVGYWLARAARFWLTKTLNQFDLNDKVVTLIERLMYYGILTLVVIVALSILGVATTSLLTLLAVVIIASLIILQPSIRNLSAGFAFHINQPFKDGDLVQTAGTVGYVEVMGFTYSTLRTLDNKLVTISNGQIDASNIVNYSGLGTLRADMEFNISYSDDVSEAKRILTELMENDPRVLREPSARVFVLELGNDGIVFAVWPFVNVEDYFEIQWDMPERVKLAFDQAGITIPFPQRDVHLYQAPMQDLSHPSSGD
jgi:small conductance mechanosensitive channel